jgi:hypothetical protein
MHSASADAQHVGQNGAKVSWSGVVELLKASTTTVAALAVAAAVLLFAPAGFVAALGLASFLASYRPFVGAALVLFSVLLLARGIAAGVALLKGKYERESDLRVRRSLLKDLTPAEAKALAGYIDNDTKTQYFSIEDGVTRGLELQQIIFRSTSVSSRGTRFAFNIQPWAREHLRRNPSLLDKGRSGA